MGRLGSYPGPRALGGPAPQEEEKEKEKEEEFEFEFDILSI